MSYDGVRVVVLGASGFIGRWTARKLSEAKSELFLFVRDANFARAVFDRYNIQGKIIECDFSTSQLEDLYRSIQPAICFNLAGYGVDQHERDEPIAYQINAELPKRICKVIAQTKNPKWQGQHLIHAGSAQEYGQIAGDLSETSVPHPTTVYGKSKLDGTKAVERGAIDFNLKSATARLFTIYGPGEHAGRLLPDLLQATKIGEDLKLTAGIQKRDFTYVEDAAEGLLRLGLTSTKPGEVINLATGKLTSVHDFAKTAATILNIPKDRLIFGALSTRTEEMEHNNVSIRRLTELLSWSPPTNISEGIQKTFEFERASDGNSP